MSARTAVPPSAPTPCPSFQPDLCGDRARPAAIFAEYLANPGQVGQYENPEPGCDSMAFRPAFAPRCVDLPARCPYRAGFRIEVCESRASWHPLRGTDCQRSDQNTAARPGIRPQGLETGQRATETQKECRNEAHLSTLEAGSRPSPRLPRPYGHQRRPPCSGSTPRQGP